MIKNLLFGILILFQFQANGQKAQIVDCICPALYAPVCVNGKTYGSECEAKCAGETTWTNGACTPKEITIEISGTSLLEKQKLNQGGIGFVPYNPDIYSGVFTLNTGTLHFEIQDIDALYTMTGTTFPNGTALKSIDAFIPVKEGKYAVEINIKTGEYNFFQTPYVNIAGYGLNQIDNKGNYSITDLEVGETVITISVNEYGNDALMMAYGDFFPKGKLNYYSETPAKTIPGKYNISFNTNTSEYKFDKNLSIGQFNNLKQINIYPNPVKNSITIESDIFTEARIFDYTGRLLNLLPVINKTIDLSALSAGNYILKLQVLNTENTIKIVKE